MFPSYAHNVVERAEQDAAANDLLNAYRNLQLLTLADFCELLLHVPPQYPHLTRMLPRMPSETMQQRWVGDSGTRLMNRSYNLVRLFELLSWRLTRQSLRGTVVLDYGCGWGRLLRLMYHAAGPALVYGIDPLDKSLELCRECGIDQRIALCDPVPTLLPFPDVEFGFIFSFSVFTHLPERVAGAVLTAARRRVADRGFYAISIRSSEFWGLRHNSWGGEVVAALQRTHAAEGYAFKPGDYNNGDVFGYTTYSVDRLRRLAKKSGWRIGAIERDFMEPFQIIVALVPIEQPGP